MRALRPVLARIRDERGFTFAEVLTTMTILLMVMGGLTQLIVSGMRAEVDMNNRFQAQTQARLALDRLRKDIHGACRSSAATASSSLTLTFRTAGTCPTSGGTQVTYCLTAAGLPGQHELRRYPSGACSGSYVRIAEQLTTAGAFTYTTPSGSLAKIAVTLAVNPDPTKPARVYRLQDELVLRNSTRTA